MTTRIGIDTGGTFTDLVAHDAKTGEVRLLKTPSTPDDPGRAILAGLSEGQRLGYWRLDQVDMIVHGTTVATNALLERHGANAAMITTRGFRDVLQIQRQNRPEMYNLRSRRPEPLIPRHRRLEITERTLHDGSVETPLDPAELSDLVEQLKALGAESVAVGLLHSHVNPTHEIQIGEAIGERLPAVSVSLSHQIACERGEFERFSTVAANAYVQPVVEGYLEKLQQRLDSIGMQGPVFVMKSSGGAGAARSVARRCVETAVSGPAGGVRACVDLARLAPNGNLIAGDMGGTSFDVAVVTGGKPQLAREASIGGLPLRVPMLDIHTIGAGGGSIAWVDAGGALRVGPESAGALPGPACYGRGGDQPTVSDANLVLGRLAGASRLAGGMQLDLPAARSAIERRLAKPLSLSVEEAALGILRISCTAMVAALRRLTIERGIDPRDYALCSFGGAGPLHAVDLAAELGAELVIVPATPGVFSAHGLLLSDLREDRFASLQSDLNQSAMQELESLAEQLAQQAEGELQAASGAGQPRLARRAAALRYRGQSADLQVEWPADKPAEAEQLASAFHAGHRARFGFDRPDQPIELVGVAISVERVLPHPPVPAPNAASTNDRLKTRREVWFDGGPRETTVVDRASLGIGQQVVGSAVIEQDDSTTVVPPGWSARVGENGALFIERTV